MDTATLVTVFFTVMVISTVTCAGWFAITKH
ncbi:hypothetical protein J2Z17_003149 [Rhizobium halophytocola]|uniref:Uncharacterized protein n=1 Tax=Rhizobium halophytocola TaxID=735519 RepID=A0ABS4E1B1_9HYPH|nr:hypothetical protein [Rhizobium halophytocola]